MADDLLERAKKLLGESSAPVATAPEPAKEDDLMERARALAPKAAPLPEPGTPPPLTKEALRPYDSYDPYVIAQQQKTAQRPTEDELRQLKRQTAAEKSVFRELGLFPILQDEVPTIPPLPDEAQGARARIEGMAGAALSPIEAVNEGAYKAIGAVAGEKQSRRLKRFAENNRIFGFEVTPADVLLAAAPLAKGIPKIPGAVRAGIEVAGEGLARGVTRTADELAFRSKDLPLLERAKLINRRAARKVEGAAVAELGRTPGELAEEAASGVARESATSGMPAPRVSKPAGADEFVAYLRERNADVEGVLSTPTRAKVALEAYAKETGTDTTPISEALGRLEVAGQRENVMHRAVLEGEIVEKPVSVQDIALDMEKALRTRLNVKLRGGRALGVFNRRIHAGAVKSIDDLDTLIHEFGHGIESKLWGERGGPAEWADVRSELVELGKALYGDVKPKGGYAREGFAEFMWLTISDPENVVARAPMASTWWNTKILPQNPKLAAQLAKIEQGVTEYLGQGAENRLLSRYTPPGTKPLSTDPVVGAGRRKFRNLQHKWWDEAGWLSEMERDIEKSMGAELLPERSPYREYSANAGTAQARAKHSLLDYQADLEGNRIGPAAMDALRPVLNAGELNELRSYHLAKHTVHSLEQRGITTGVELADARTAVAKYESGPQWNHIVRAQREVTRFLQNELGLYMKEVGNLEGFERMVKANPYYMPLRRFFKDLYGGAGGGAGGSLRRRTGGTRPIKDYLTQLWEYTNAMRQGALRARMERKLGDLAELPGSGAWIKEVSGKQVPPIVKRIGDLKKQLENAGADLTAADLDEVIDVWTGRKVLPTDEPIIAIPRGDGVSYFQLHPDLYKAYMEMGPKQMNALMRLSRSVTNVMKLGATGLKGGFAVANFERAIWETFIADPAGKGVVGNFPKHLYNVFKGTAKAARGAVGELFPSLRKTRLGRRLLEDREVGLYRSLGQDMSEFIRIDRALRNSRGVSDLQRAFQRELKPTFLGDVGRLFRHPIETLRSLFGITESGPRLQQIGKVMEGGLVGPISEREALKIAEAVAEGGPNFRRMGTISRMANAVVPFFSAQINGNLMFFRTAIKHPVRTFVRGATWITLPSLYLWWRNKDDPRYQDLPSWRRYGGWNIYTTSPEEDPEGTPYFIPAPHSIALVFKMIPEALAQMAYREDKENAFSEETKALLEEGANNLFPVTVDMTEDMPTAFWSALRNIGAIAPAVDVVSNRRFGNRPIVPKRLEKYPAHSKKAAYTSAWAQLVANTVAKLTNSGGVSPAHLDYLVRGYTGGSLSDFIQVIESAVGYPLKDEALLEAADTAWVGRFAPRTVSSSRAYQELWKEYGILRAKDLDWKQRRREGEKDWTEYRLSPDEQRRLTDLNKAIGRIGAAYERLDAVKVGTRSVEAAQKEAEAIRGQIVRIARDVMKRE